MQSVYNAQNLIEGHIVAGLLRANGLDCHVGGHYLQGAVGEVAPLGLTRLWVDDTDVASALRILADYEAGRLNVSDDGGAPDGGTHTG